MTLKVNMRVSSISNVRSI